MTTAPIKLTKRQNQLLALLNQGMSNKTIATEIQVSEHTVKVHMWRLFQRLGVRSRTQAVKWWHDNHPTGTQFALRAAFDAACRMADQLKVDGGLVDIEEFEFHRAQVQQMQGAA
jgi:DNA-binding CsgD family transcriptional regulator